MSKGKWIKKKSQNTVGRSTGITLQVVYCLLCGAEEIRKHFLARHWSKHKGEVFNGKPCESYTFPRVKNRLQLDAVCSSSRPTNPPTTNNKRLDTVMQNHVIAETRLNDLLWLIESKLAMDKTLGLHFYVSATPSRLLMVNQRKVSSTLFG